MRPSAPSSEFGPPLYLAEILYAGLQKRWLISGVCFACILGGLLYIFLTEQQFTSRALVVPVSEQGGESALGETLGLLPLQGMGSLLKGNAVATETNIALETLKTRTFLKRLLAQHDGLAAILLDDCVMSASSGLDLPLCGNREVGRATSRWQKSILTSGINEETGIYWIEITLPDPDLAAQVANLVVRQVDQVMRMQKLATTRSNISYLASQLESTSQAEVRNTIAALLQKQVEQQMLASNEGAYVFRVLDEAVPPAEPSAPRPMLIMIAAVVLGFILGFTLALISASRAALAGESTIRYSHN